MAMPQPHQHSIQQLHFLNNSNNNGESKQQLYNVQPQPAPYTAFTIERFLINAAPSSEQVILHPPSDHYSLPPTFNVETNYHINNSVAPAQENHFHYSPISTLTAQHPYTLSTTVDTTFLSPHQPQMGPVGDAQPTRPATLRRQPPPQLSILIPRDSVNNTSPSIPSPLFSSNPTASPHNPHFSPYSPFSPVPNLYPEVNKSNTTTTTSTLSLQSPSSMTPLEEEFGNLFNPDGGDESTLIEQTSAIISPKSSPTLSSSDGFLHGGSTPPAPSLNSDLPMSLQQHQHQYHYQYPLSSPADDKSFNTNNFMMMKSTTSVKPSSLKRSNTGKNSKKRGGASSKRKAGEMGDGGNSSIDKQQQQQHDKNDGDYHKEDDDTGDDDLIQKEQLDPKQAIYLQKKIVSSQGIPRFQCPCGKLFQKLCGLKSHIKVHETNKSRLVRNSETGLLEWIGTDGIAIKVPTSEIEKTYNCELCGRSFLRRQDLRRHKVVHSDTYKRFTCGNCSTTFSRSDALFRHIKARRCHKKEESEDV